MAPWGPRAPQLSLPPRSLLAAAAMAKGPRRHQWPTGAWRRWRPANAGARSRRAAVPLLPCCGGTARGWFLERSQAPSPASRRRRSSCPEAR
eukprot:9452892-Pyramimonas_sp.AAC.1